MSNQYGTCPLGGLWYTCTEQTPTFLGCCLSNPCNGAGCPSQDLRAAGMGTGSGPDLSSNDSSYWPNVQCSSGLWYTCALQTPSFQGCCDSNPCGGAGCPAGDLSPAAFVSDPALTSTTLPTSMTTLASTLTTTPVDATGHTVTITATSSTGISTSDSTPMGQTSHPTHSDAAAIAGAVSGGVAILSLIALVFCLYRRRKRKHSLVSNPDLAEAAETSENCASGVSVFGNVGKSQSQVEANPSELYSPTSDGQQTTKHHFSPPTSPSTRPRPPSYHFSPTDLYNIGIGSSNTAHKSGIDQSRVSTSSELDSNPVHEMLPHDSSRRHSTQLDMVSELPNSAAIGSDRRRKSTNSQRLTLAGLTGNEGGLSSPVSDRSVERDIRKSYTSWQSLSP